MQRFLTGDKNLDSLILSKLRNEDLSNICLVSKYGKELYDYEPMWYKKLEIDFPSFLKFKPQNLKFKDYYLPLSKRINGLMVWWGMFHGGKGEEANEFFLKSHPLLKNETLLVASENGLLEIVKYLVENGADIHYINDSVLTVAVEGGHLEVLKYLMEKRIHIMKNTEDFLKLASRKGHVEIVKYFLGMVSDHPHLSYLKLDSLKYAIKNGHLDLTKYLLENENIDYSRAGLLKVARRYSTDILKYVESRLGRNY